VNVGFKNVLNALTLKNCMNVKFVIMPDLKEKTRGNCDDARGILGDVRSREV
jgi:hypothetical protein